MIESLEPRRLLAAGELDPTFSSDGIARFDFGGDERAMNALPTPDGKLLVWGEFATRPSAIRVTGRGGLDTTFGDAGQIENYPIAGAFNPSKNQALVAIDPSTGRIALGVGSEVRVFNRDAVVDTSFSDDGIVSFTPSVGAIAFQ